MNGAYVATVIFLMLAVIEGFNGLRLAFRARRTLESIGLRYEEGLGLLIQEFGIYSLGIAAAYLMAAFDPVRFWGIALTGITINLAAGAMHLLRSVSIYFGDTRPMMSQGFERKAGLVHAAAAVVLVIAVAG